MFHKQRSALSTELNYSSHLKTHLTKAKSDTILVHRTVRKQPIQHTHQINCVYVQRIERFYIVQMLVKCECVRVPNMNDDIERTIFHIKCARKFLEMSKNVWS